MYTKYISEILQELQECLSSGSTAEFAMIGQLIDQAEKIFVAGMGRTGYVMKGFTMRLEQAGYEAYWIGDTNTPAAGKGDLLILGSGSGETETLKVYAKKGKRTTDTNYCVYDMQGIVIACRRSCCSCD